VEIGNYIMLVLEKPRVKAKVPITYETRDTQTSEEWPDNTELIDDLEDRIKKLKNEINKLEEDKKSLKFDIEELLKKIAKLEETNKIN